MTWIKCKCGTWSDCIKCFWCSGEKHKTPWRKKYKATKKRVQQMEANSDNDPEKLPGSVF